MAKLIGVCKDMPHYIYPDKPEDWRAHMEEQDAALKKIEEASKKALETNDPIGFIMSFSVADGKALYRVASIKPLSLEHVPYGDAYQVPPAMIRGINITEVRQAMERARIWDKIFSS
jgi:hypothetical protein